MRKAINKSFYDWPLAWQYLGIGFSLVVAFAVLQLSLGNILSFKLMQHKQILLSQIEEIRTRQQIMRRAHDLQKHFSRLVDKNKNLSTSLVEITDIAKDQKIQLESMKPLESLDKAWSKQTLQITAQGSYFEIMNFLKTVNSLSYLSSLDNLKIIAPVTGFEHSFLQLNFQLSIYSLTLL